MSKLYVVADYTKGESFSFSKMKAAIKFCKALKKKSDIAIVEQRLFGNEYANINYYSRKGKFMHSY